MKIPKRKTRSDKFPLTLHPTGQYCKKINGKIRYFGKDKKKALEKYLAQATYLHGAQSLVQKISNGKMTLKQLCDLYLHYQNSRVLVGDITAFEGVWYEVLDWLQQEPDVTAKRLLERLQYKYPERFAGGQLRTLQRRVKEWRKIMARELVYACMEQ